MGIDLEKMDPQPFDRSYNLQPTAMAEKPTA